MSPNKEAPCPLETPWLPLLPPLGPLPRIFLLPLPQTGPAVHLGWKVHRKMPASGLGHGERAALGLETYGGGGSAGAEKGSGGGQCGVAWDMPRKK